MKSINALIISPIRLKCRSMVCMLTILIVFLSCETDDEQTVTRLTDLVLSEEFDSDGAPNSELWDYDIGRGPNGDGWGNQEYVRDMFADPVSTEIVKSVKDH